ncbi:MAG: PaaI family thioesterase [Methyloprofundus sp.]|nr:PaaI family thioesterase [Methyloprofundus sp.]
MQQNILAQLLELMPLETGMELPPKIFMDMSGEFIAYVADKSLTVRFPNKERYMNPFGFMQGGMIVAAMDNTIAPLSYIVAPPNITKEFNTAFKRPITPKDEYIEVIASIIERTATQIILQAEVSNAKGKLAATGIATCVFIKARAINVN